MRTTLDYYRMFAGWPPNAGSVAGMMNDVASLSMDRKAALRQIIQSAITRKGISDHDVAEQVLARL